MIQMNYILVEETLILKLILKLDTRKRSNLLWKTRCLKRDKKIQDCWSSDGTILVKTNEHKIISIRNMVDVDKF